MTVTAVLFFVRPQCRTRYEYDRVFPQTSTQEEVFEAVQPLCVSVLDGYNVCIFAYGQTGSGKTFTMEGSAGNKGVSPRAIEELLSQIEQAKDSCTYAVTLSMLEIYNETILDLLPLNPNPKEKEKLEIRQTGDGNQVVGLTETTVSFYIR
jgi:kinesin family protein C2/C3